MSRTKSGRGSREPVVVPAQPERVRELLAEVVPAASLASIRLVEAALAVEEGGKRPVRAEPLQTSVVVHRVGGGGGIECRVAFEFDAAVPGREGAGRVARVRAAYVVSYRLATGAKPSREALETFGLVNAAFHAWPYWREFLQSSLQRLELPRLTLPLMRVEQFVEQTPVQRSRSRSG